MIGILLQTVFLGRFHPLVVHLPIGFILLAAIFFSLSYFEKYSFLLKTLPVILLAGAISSLVAVVLGWLLSNEGGYSVYTLGWHQWLGISVTIIVFTCWLWISGFVGNANKKIDKKLQSSEASLQRIVSNKRNIGLTMILLFVLISVTGHLGGNLTHGDQYLFEHAPAFLQLSSTGGNRKAVYPSDPDSILLYSHLIMPFIKSKCTSCHNETKKKGGLVLTTRDDLLKGGENGAVLENGSPQNSELFKRVCLDPSSKKFMPPKGTPLSYTEISLLGYWISSGMSFDLSITNENIPSEIKTLIQQSYSLSTEKKSYAEKEKVTPASMVVLDSLRKLGFKIQKLSLENNFLEVVAKDSLTKSKIESLLKIKEQITWLDLGKTGLQDNWMSVLKMLPNLTRLTLSNNNITDAGIVYLTEFKHLESINLHSTKMSDIGLKLLCKLNSLKRLYLWQTKVASKTVDSIRNEIPTLEIDLGVIQAKEK